VAPVCHHSSGVSTGTLYHSENIVHCYGLHRPVASDCPQYRRQPDSGDLLFSLPAAWSRLPSAVNVLSLNAFKHKLKTYLFRSL